MAVMTVITVMTVMTVVTVAWWYSSSEVIVVTMVNPLMPSSVSLIGLPTLFDELPFRGINF
jgi:hypothetical protein